VSFVSGCRLSEERVHLCVGAGSPKCNCPKWLLSINSKTSIRALRSIPVGSETHRWTQITPKNNLLDNLIVPQLPNIPFLLSSFPHSRPTGIWRSKDIAPLILNLGNWRRSLIKFTTRLLLPQRKKPTLPTEEEAGQASHPVWMFSMKGKLHPAGIRTRSPVVQPVTWSLHRRTYSGLIPPFREAALWAQRPNPRPLYEIQGLELLCRRS